MAQLSRIARRTISRLHGRFGGGSDSDRGASLVEFSIAAALMAALAIGGLQAVSSASDDVHADQTASIGNVVRTDDGEGDGEAEGGPSLSASCEGPSCRFSVTSPADGATYSWSASPDGGSGTGTAFNITGMKNGGPYTVTLTVGPGGETTTRTVTCTKGIETTCTAS